MAEEKKHNSGFLALVNDAKSRIRQMNLDEYRQMLNSGAEHMLIDIREESEWAGGHAAGALHVGKGIIERDIETVVPDKDRTLILYCGGGYRSALSADALTKMGYENVISLDGGWRAYRKAGLPVEGSQPQLNQSRDLAGKSSRDAKEEAVSSREK